MAFPRVPVTDITHAEPAPFGILSPAASVVIDDSDYWTSGFEYESLDCGTTVRLSSMCTAPSGVEIISGNPSDRWRSYTPFSVETEFSCSTMGGAAMDYQARANERLAACQQKAIEREFWTGTLAKREQAADPAYPNRFLASSSAVDVTPTAGTAVKPKYGLALLEAALADCGCGVRGTIHMTRGAASGMGLSGSDASAALMTPLNNFVVAGAGYTGTGPNGQKPAGSAVWMYATGPLTVRLGAVSQRASNLRDNVDIRTNSVKVFADRFAAVTYDTCCHFGVLVDLSLDYS